MSGLATATGGGILRDILLGDFPLFCFKDTIIIIRLLAISLSTKKMDQGITVERENLSVFYSLG